MTDIRNLTLTRALLLSLALGWLGINLIVRQPAVSRASGCQSLAAQPPTLGAALQPAADGAERVPAGLAAADWQSIKQAYERRRHAAFAVPGERRARNHGQRWLTRFDGRGFVVEPDRAGWRWGLALRSYGFPGQQRALSGQAQVTTEQERVAYDWEGGLQEWFVNDRRGLEHGFTLRERPAGAGEHLELRLAVRGGLRPQVQPGGRAVSFVDAAGSAVVNYAGLKVWDAAGRELAARLEASGEELRVQVEEDGARYPLTIDPIAQQAYLKASNTEADDRFGWSVAISGDTAVVGAPGEDSDATGVNGAQNNNNAIESGAVYVFVRNGASWSQQAYLKASNTGTEDVFGWSVAISGDTLVVGARLEDSNATGVNGNQTIDLATDSGAAYVFVRSAGLWSQQAYLKASNTGTDDNFGNSVAISGDTLVVGADQEASNATGVNGNQTNNSALLSGAAYVFVRSAGVWSQQAYLKASNTGADDNFGNSVAISGDTVVVGAVDESSNATGVNAPLTGGSGTQADNSALFSGAAYVFVRSAGLWSQQAYLKASNTGANDAFGWSVAVSGDTVVVGARLEDSNATRVNAPLTGCSGTQADNSAGNSGAAYVFVRSAGMWSQQAYLKASNTEAVDVFGYSVAISGDTVVAGAQLEDSDATGVNGDQSNNSATDAGAAYVFLIPSLTLSSSRQCFAAPGGMGQFTVKAAAGENWQALSNDPFISIASPPGGQGSGTAQVSFTVSSHSNTVARSGMITVAEESFSVLQGAQFNDVPVGHLFYNEISKVSARGITLGCGNGNYCPTDFVTREQMAAFIIRALGDFNPPAPAQQRFADVPPTNIFYAFIEQMAVRQITLGCGDGNYCPSNFVTREQMAAFIIRALHAPGYLPPAPAMQRFADVPPSNPFYAHIEEMAVCGITLGCGGGNYCPSDFVTRGQMAAFLIRAFSC